MPGNGSYFIFVNLPSIGSKVTEISKISVVMYVSDHFVYGKLQLTQYWGLLGLLNKGYD